MCVLAFVEDLYIVAKTLTEGQIMTNELILALAVVGLRPKTAKTQWICDDFESALERGDCLIVEGVAVKPSKHMKILGSMISGDGSEKGFPPQSPTIMENLLPLEASA